MATKFRKLKVSISQPKADFVAILLWFRSQRLISQPAKLAFSLVWSASNGSNAFISTLNRAPFKALDFWLPELRNDIKHAQIGLQEVLQKWLKLLSSRMLQGRFSLYLSSLHAGLVMAKDFRASKLWFFMFLSFPLLFHGFQRTLLNLGLLWWSNY